MKTLKRQEHSLADSFIQLQVLNQATQQGTQFPAFAQKLKQSGLVPYQPTGITIFQMNLGKMCNQVCKHCHVDAGPDRREIMTRATMEECLTALAGSDIPLVDLTGGAPEMNPDFRWLVEQLTLLGKKVMVRCNLTIILANKKYHDLPEFYKEHQVHVVSSLPYFTAARTNAQRGDGVFEDSIKALQMLNTVGYGQVGSGLEIDLVYNPSGAFLPGNQLALQNEFKKKLKAAYNIAFNNLFAITNLPISRFLDYLIESNNYDGYMEKLVNAYNPTAAANTMCRNTLSIGWDGYLYDCDFNQMLDLKVSTPGAQHISQFDLEELNNRSIVVNQHCYGCTAGAGSSCGGATA
ncbi:radical SAM protein [Adhaeribacter arboris]|uniref:Radical SAM protein n=1 Tax=Adhaeribacter arboris TaxID=2072846 RepID=A0A2T2YAY3_9BACT|nr:arsenosugar biosynthesis radical SAM (seleno)protein ArsS [Adhaeribacter arboris]PSR52598.1 radical SAM protein [Adhaeribacter arboris]